MINEMCIREVSKADAEQLVELLKKLSVQTKYMLRELDEINAEVSEQENKIESMLSNKSTLFLVSEVNKKVVGFLVANSNDLKRVKHIGELVIGVDQEHWGMGIGRGLMEEMLVWSEKNGLKRLALEVVSENDRAVKMYERYGFKIEGKKVADHYVGDGKYLDTLVMGKMLDESILAGGI